MMPMIVPLPIAPARRTRLIAGSGLLLLMLAACGRLGGPHQRGERALRAGDYAAAIDAYTDAVRADATDAVAYANRCYAYEAIGNLQAAVDDCTASLDLASAKGAADAYPRWQVLNNRGVALLGLRQYEKARADFDAALALQPEYAEALANRGRVHYEMEQYEQAEEDLTRAIEIDDGLAQAYGNRALTREALGDDEQALADYGRAIELSHDPQAYFNRAMLSYTLGRFDEAYDDFVEVARLDPDGNLGYQASQQVRFLENRPTPEQ